jgi:hypothetical protein
LKIASAALELLIQAVDQIRHPAAACFQESHL